MLPNSYTSSFPPPTLTCPHCPQRFRNKSGRTRHIAHHLTEGSDSHGPNTAAHTSPVPSLEPSFHDQSPAPHFTPSPSHDDFDDANPTNIDVDIDHPNHNPNPNAFHTSPVPSSPSIPPSCDRFNVDSDIDMDIEPRITRVFHPKLNGMSKNIYIYIHFH